MSDPDSEAKQVKQVKEEVKEEEVPVNSDERLTLLRARPFPPRVPPRRLWTFEIANKPRLKADNRSIAPGTDGLAREKRRAHGLHIHGRLVDLFRKGPEKDPKRTRKAGPALEPGSIMVSNMENLNPQVMRYLGKEIQSLHAHPLEGVRVLVNDKDITSIEALVDGPADTPYAGGRFRVRLVLGKDFPASPPKGLFLTKIFHPNVSAKGEICVNTLKRDWQADLGLKHILLTIKCLLIVPNAESALNEEAGKLLLEHYDDYCTRARLYTEIHAQSTAGPGWSSSPSSDQPLKESSQSHSSRSSGSKSSSSQWSATSSSSANASASASAATDPANKKMGAKTLAKKEKSIKDKKRQLKRL
ncbi:ubiquitin-conjugating enzyme E2 S-like [Tigriopus californicus]|uniref:ubiquitin-conjugating enzyme E2 S-like n=1 Tax=Tigriopus californicus TaxID=6832 RepID=UPI0027DA445F|nr:ubiquitin-conjugating enzyme E2 S-like [Tigriopus californicus]